MSTFFYLSTCDTCKRIMNEINLSESIKTQDIKTKPLTEEDLVKMKELSGSYESLFSKRARLYKERNLNEQVLDENDYKDLLLEHYTFLKRPVLLTSERIFIGNSKAVVAEMKNFLQENS